MAAKANFSAYHNYVTDSLHQWDLNQVLTLWGLNLASAPEVHFSNKNMDRAIVRQATMENHVVTVNIPNSLLQHPLRIYAHIGIYVGRAFTVVETVEIPVIPRVRPLDYQIEDNDGEIYSFKALENALANKADAAAINARVDNIIANANTTEGNTELVDIRADANGTVYASAGAAVRGQSAAVKNAVQYAFDIGLDDGVIVTEIVPGYIDASGNLTSPGSETMEVTTGLISLQPDDILRFEVRCATPGEQSDWATVSFYNADGSYATRHTLSSKVLYVCNDGAYSAVRFSCRTFGTPCVIASRKNMSAISDKIPSAHHKHNQDYIPLTWHNGFYSGTGDVQIYEHSPLCEVRTELIPVTPGEKYRLVSIVSHDRSDVDATGQYHWAAVAMYDQTGAFIDRNRAYTVTEDVQPYTIDEEFTIPAGVGYIALCGRTYWSAKYSLSRVLATVSVTGAADHPVRAVAHRGHSAGAPENTLAAYRLAKESGFAFAECDVSFTSDGVAVLLHDSTIDRTSNGSGNISALTFAAVRALDFGGWFSSAYAGEKIPTFEEFIALCRAIGLRPYVELKAGTEEQIKSLVDTVNRYGMREKTTWISFTAAYLSNVKDKDDRARLGFVVDAVTADTTTTAQSLQTEHNEVFVDCAYNTAAAGAELCISARIPMEAWTVNDESAIKTLDPYISGVTSDSLVAGRVLYEANI